jgi:hypothetical protein
MKQPVAIQQQVPGFHLALRLGALTHCSDYRDPGPLAQPDHDPGGQRI